ncbi:hypothetical protein AB4Z27_25635, partial [Cupriavidus sp. KB_39]|uniref:hypothetical protein n=1 Tax=Cupriavidus sp. KB_39 TaxID=3233036 RepID=UPI003F8DA26F
MAGSLKSGFVPDPSPLRGLTEVNFSFIELTTIDNRHEKCCAVTHAAHQREKCKKKPSRKTGWPEKLLSGAPFADGALRRRLGHGYRIDFQFRAIVDGRAR